MRADTLAMPCKKNTMGHTIHEPKHEDNIPDAEAEEGWNSACISLCDYLRCLVQQSLLVGLVWWHRFWTLGFCAYLGRDWTLESRCACYLGETKALAAILHRPECQLASARKKGGCNLLCTIRKTGSTKMSRVACMGCGDAVVEGNS